jgi:GxxExxY protein
MKEQSDETMGKLYEEQLTGQIIGAAVEVHRQLGLGLLESSYQACLCRELELRGISFACQKPLPLAYKGVKLDCGYRIDLLVAGLVIVEIKSVEALAPIHEAQLLTYMKLTGVKIGLLMNFDAVVLKDGIRRLVH